MSGAPRNPADGVKPPRKTADDRHTVEVWSVEQLGRSEVLGLNWSTVDWSTGSIRVEAGRVKVGTSKTTARDEPRSKASRRTVPVGQEVATHLQFYVTSTDDSVSRPASRFGAVLSGTAAVAASS